MKYKLKEVFGNRFICIDGDYSFSFDSYSAAYQFCYYWNINNMDKKVELVDYQGNRLVHKTNMDGYTQA